MNHIAEIETNRKAMRRELLTSGFKLLTRRKRPTLTREFNEMLYGKALELDDQLGYEEFTQGLGKQVNAEVCRWRKKGWVAGTPGYSYLWRGPRELKKVIKS